jgi:SNF family Na+-dependent transporter
MLDNSSSDRLLVAECVLDERPAVVTPPPQEKKTKKSRDIWVSEKTFRMAAIGAVLGFGNIMQFPAHIYESGGGIWIFPYLLCTMFVGIPMIILETLLGQIVRKNPVDTLGVIHPALKGLGYLSITVAFLISCYYAMYTAYAAVYVVESLGGTMDWSWENDKSDPCEIGYYSQHHFYMILGIHDEDCNEVQMDRLTSPALYLVIGVIFTMSLVFACTFQGIERLSKIVYMTVLFPVILLFVLMCQCLTLEGGMDGVRTFFMEWDLKDLNNGVRWAETVKDVFFSLSICCGIFMSYGSYIPSKEKRPVIGNAIEIGFVNVAVNLVSAVVVFAPLGHASLKSQITVKQYIETYGVSGPNLLFASLPRALSYIETNPSYFATTALYSVFFLLGLQSLIAGVEPLISFLCARFKRKYSRPQISAGVCIVAVGIGCILSSPQGFYFGVDAFSYFLKTWGLLSIGLAQVIIAGWVVGFEDACERINKGSVSIFVGTYFVACIVSIVVFFTTGTSFRGGAWNSWDVNGSETSLNGEDHTYDPYTIGFEAFLGVIIWQFIMCVGWGCSYYCSKLEFRAWLHACLDYGIQDFVDVLKDLSGQPTNSQASEKHPVPKHSSVWLFMWKYIIKFCLPYLFMILLGDAFRRDIGWWNTTSNGPGKSVENGDIVRTYPEIFVAMSAGVLGVLIVCAAIHMLLPLCFTKTAKITTHHNLRWKEAIAVYCYKAMGVDLFNSESRLSNSTSLLSWTAHTGHLSNWSYNPADKMSMMSMMSTAMSSNPIAKTSKCPRMRGNVNNMTSNSTVNSNYTDGVDGDII